MSFLYINNRGISWRKHSYSSGLIFDQSPFKYYLQKILGWREKDNKARFLFGKAVEEAIQQYHEHDGHIAIGEDFESRWSAHKDNSNISYTNVEKNWDTCRIMGRDLVKLYAVLQPKLPIPMGARSVWQRNYSKEVFVGDPNYGGIDFEGRLDIVCYADPNHPMLPAVDWKTEYGPYRPLIVDIKTSGVEFPEQPGLAALDSQLKVYSWVSGIRDVALLWLVKKGLGYKKGYTVYFLEKTKNFDAGDSGVIASVDEAYAYVVKTDFMVAELDRVVGKKGDEELKYKWLKQYSERVPLTAVTKQMIQFNAGRVSEQSAIGAGQIAGRQIMGIVNAYKNKSWPDTFGVRYPRDDRNDSYFRAFVLKDDNYKKQNFTKSDEQDFDELFEETE